MNSGILKGTASFEDYADPSFVNDETVLQPIMGGGEPARRRRGRPHELVTSAGLPTAWSSSPDPRVRRVVGPRGGSGSSLLLGPDRAALGERSFLNRSTSLRGIVELVEKGLLLKYIVASLFRVTWGFTLAVLWACPLGCSWAGLRPFQALNPLIQMLRPISPIAWIPVAILWFGVFDAAPIFLIFLASFFTITVSTMLRCKTCSPFTCGPRRTSGSANGALPPRDFPASLRRS